MAPSFYEQEYENYLKSDKGKRELQQLQLKDLMRKDIEAEIEFLQAYITHNNLTSYLLEKHREAFKGIRFY